MFGKALHPKDKWANTIIALYYERLNDDADFRAALAELCETLAEPGRRLKELWELSDTPQFSCYPFRPVNIREESTIPQWDYYRLYNTIGQEMSAFCERWHLPTAHGLADVWRSLDWYLVRPDLELKLRQGVQTFRVPDVGLTVTVPIDKAIEGDTAGQWIEKLPLIIPDAPSPFLYDPVERDRAWLNERIDAICANVRQSILNQAKALEGQAKAEGWDKRPPRYTDAYLQCVAKALYLKAIKGEKWSDIAGKYGVFSPDDFGKRMRDFATQCGIPLPEARKRSK